MRRTAKMLALLITLVMILGAFAILANAAADDYQVSGDGITNITQGSSPAADRSSALIMKKRLKRKV